MEFTPFTGLRLRVPLQWEPIQLMALKWYKWVLASTSATVKENTRQKVFKTPLCEITIWSSKDKEPKM